MKLSNTDSVKVQFYFGTALIEEIDNLVAETGVGSRKEFVNNSLALIMWAIAEKKRGRRVVSVGDDDSRTEVILPVLASVFCPKHEPEQITKAENQSD